MIESHNVHFQWQSSHLSIVRTKRKYKQVCNSLRVLAAAVTIYGQQDEKKVKDNTSSYERRRRNTIKSTKDTNRSSATTWQHLTNNLFLVAKPPFALPHVFITQAMDDNNFSVFLAVLAIVICHGTFRKKLQLAKRGLCHSHVRFDTSYFQVNHFGADYGNNVPNCFGCGTSVRIDHNSTCWKPQHLGEKVSSSDHWSRKLTRYKVASSLAVRTQDRAWHHCNDCLGKSETIKSAFLWLYLDS